MRPRSKASTNPSLVGGLAEGSEPAWPRGPAETGWGSSVGAPSEGPVGERCVDDGPLEGEPVDAAWAWLQLEEPIGRGGMGIVYRARDTRLDRVVALKVMVPELAHHPVLVNRFIAEARATARLGHPGVVPVHTIGRAPDGRPFFTMDVIRGRTWAQMNAALPAVLDTPWLRRQVDILRRVAETVAAAHAEGIVHRDIKPDNVMVGDLGQVIVLDWGIAAAVGEGEAASGLRADREGQTQVGVAIGTPAFMAPEQQRGERPTPAFDVWAMGLILRDLLQGFRPGDWTQGPTELVSLCRAALEPAATDRPPTGQPVAQALTAWLDGAHRRAQALTQVEQATATMIEEARLRAAADRDRRRAIALLDGLPTWSAVGARAPGWALEDAAAAQLEAADRLESERLALLQAALQTAPDCGEAHAALADSHREMADRAERAGQAALARRHTAVVARHDQGRLAGWLRGEAAVSLVTRPAGARVSWSTWRLEGRRLVAEPQGVLGLTPLVEVPLPTGSHLLTIEAPGCAPVRYPVSLRRGEHWDGRDLGGNVREIGLPVSGALSPGEIYVPAGWWWAGSPHFVGGAATPTRRWTEGYVIQRRPVTVGEYLNQMNHLTRDGRADEAAALMPRERSGSLDVAGAPCFAQTAEGLYQVMPDQEGDVWDLDWPMLLVTWHQARAYARLQPGRAWDLPTEDQREKASRGVDGREWPWGDLGAGPWSCLRGSRPGRPLPAVVEDFPADEGPYGARGMAGNVRDWCLDPWRPDATGPAEERVVKGLSFFFGPMACPLAARFALGAQNRADTVGFRLAAASLE